MNFTFTYVLGGSQGGAILMYSPGAQVEALRAGFVERVPAIALPFLDWREVYLASVFRCMHSCSSVRALQH